LPIGPDVQSPISSRSLRRKASRPIKEPGFRLRASDAVDRTKKDGQFKAKSNFCSEGCYFATRSDTKYTEHRQGQRRARAAVSKVFDIPPGAVVHHEDKNQDHNDLANLKVFAAQSDHLRFHHRVNPAKPIWDGEQYLAGLELPIAA
jgi:hypothetical protein